MMELCLYNAVLTAMSHDGKAFTYINQLASSDTDLSQREDWFTVACCPPNMLRILGCIGGYVWTRNISKDLQSATVTVNLYIPSTLKFKIEDQEVRISQQTEWPWQGDVQFTVDCDFDHVGVQLRIPGWATSYQIHPPCPNAVLERGYLTLPADFVKNNRTFSLSIPMVSRWIAPHPYTGQNTLSLARGPIIYCVEDYDNPWVVDHFKVRGLSLFFSPFGKPQLI